MYNQTKVQVALVAIAVLFVLFGDRMAALAAVLTYAIVDYITTSHYRRSLAAYHTTQSLWWFSLTAHLVAKSKKAVKHDASLPYAAGVKRGIEITGYTNFIVEIPAGENPDSPKTIVLKRQIELAPGTFHEIPVYRVSSAGATPVGTQVDKPTGTTAVQKQLF